MSETSGRTFRVKLFSSSIRRFTLPASAGLGDLQDRAAHQQTGVLPSLMQYLDDEGDWITISCELEWKQAVLAILLAEETRLAGPESTTSRPCVLKVRVSYSQNILRPVFLTSSVIDTIHEEETDTVIDSTAPEDASLYTPTAPSPDASSSTATTTPELPSWPEIASHVNDPEWMREHAPQLGSALGSGLSQFAESVGGWGPLLSNLSGLLGGGGGGGGGGLGGLGPLLAGLMSGGQGQGQGQQQQQQPNWGQLASAFFGQQQQSSPSPFSFGPHHPSMSTTSPQSPPFSFGGTHPTMPGFGPAVVPPSPPQSVPAAPTRSGSSVPSSADLQAARLNFQAELISLAEMGFGDEEANLRLLMKYAGDMPSVMNELFG